MKYLTPANGDIVERDDIPQSLIDAGIYVPVERSEDENVSGALRGVPAVPRKRGRPRKT